MSGLPIQIQKQISNLFIVYTLKLGFMNSITTYDITIKHIVMSKLNKYILISNTLTVL